MPRDKHESVRGQGLDEHHVHSEDEELPAKAEGVEAEEKEVSALEAAEKRVEEYLSLLQRTQADFVNYKRRVEQEREEQKRLASASVISKVLPVLDDLQRALQSVPAEYRDADWVEGIEFIERKLINILSGEGVSRIDAVGKDFNPLEHEALAYAESTDHDEGKVREVVREGYKLGNRVLRPAQVIVSSGSRANQ